MNALLSLLLPLCLGAVPADTLRISDLFTTHVIFGTELIYADLSNSQSTAAKILDQSRNIMAVKARVPFSSPLSVSALGADGVMRTFIVLFDEHPRELVVDLREDSPDVNGNESPSPEDLISGKRELWHLSDSRDGVTAACVRLLVLSDALFAVFEIGNGSAVGWDCADAAFVVETRRRARRGAAPERTVVPRSRRGTASCAPEQKTRVAYSLEKLTLARDQVLRVYFHERGGNRELSLTLGPEDVNRARSIPPTGRKRM